MFLSKDFLDDGGGASDFQQAVNGLTAPTTRSVGAGFGQGGNSYGSSGMARPTSSSGRPGASLLANEGGDEGDEQATPTSAATLRQKMLQQRQRALAKQRSGVGAGPVAASSMVMANDNLPASGGAAPPTPTSGMGSTRPATAMSVGSYSAFSDFPGGAPRSAASTMPSLDGAASSMSHGEKDGLVLPADVTEEDTKEAEARRRTALAQDLDERGVTPVFDPTPAGGPTGREVQFDVGQIALSEMRAFLLNPAPKNAGMIECRIIRERCGLNKLFPKYTLESDAGVFMMAAKKQKHNKTSNYTISMNKDNISKEGGDFLGKLRSNFLGLEFIAYGNGLNPKKIDPNMSQMHAMQLARQEFVAIQYSSSLWGGSKPRGPRKMSAVIPRVLPSGERMMCKTLNADQDGLVALQKAGNTGQIETFSNKPPKWNEQIGAFVLNFNKRVTQASVKNFQFTNADDPDTVFLQFGRVGKDVFNIDFRYPFSPFQAFAICLSSFDYKLCCE